MGKGGKGKGEKEKMGKGGKGKGEKEKMGKGEKEKRGKRGNGKRGMAGRLAGSMMFLPDRLIARRKK